MSQPNHTLRRDGFVFCLSKNFQFHPCIFVDLFLFKAYLCDVLYNFNDERTHTPDITPTTFFLIELCSIRFGHFSLGITSNKSENKQTRHFAQVSAG